MMPIPLDVLSPIGAAKEALSTPAGIAVLVVVILLLLAAVVLIVVKTRGKAQKTSSVSSAETKPEEDTKDV